MRHQLPLSDAHAARLYEELSQRGAFCRGEKSPWPYPPMTEEELYTLALLQSRHDPRLLAILVDLFTRRLIALEPISFKHSLQDAEALPIAAVLGTFVIGMDAPEENQDLFRYLQASTRPVPTQLFYQQLYPLGSHKLEEVLQHPLWPFKKWGFLAGDPPLLKERVNTRRLHLYDQTSRLALLRELASTEKRFRLRDYLTCVHNAISRQQGLQDLSLLKGLEKKGKGRGAYYVSRSLRGSKVASERSRQKAYSQSGRSRVVAAPKSRPLGGSSG